MGDRLGTLGAVDFPFVRVPKPLRELSTLGIFLQIQTGSSGKGGTGASPGTHPTLETNKQT